MSVVRAAAKSGIWFAFFKFATQLVTWSITVMVARVLSPADYGLMSLASILTGYIEVFSELGLGSAIVQRENISQQEYSSNFWFSLLVGAVFALVAVGLSYPTAWIFNEPRVLPITQVISVFFVIGAVTTVPVNILMRDLRFKTMGMIQLGAATVSSLSMLWMAFAGYGVWTLVGGTFILRSISTIAVFAVTRWRPDLHFRWSEVRGFLKFGLNIVGARSLFFVFQRSDVFVIGKVLGTEAVGFYAFARQLASMPTDKIASIVNQVSFPLFSRFQHDIKGVQSIYLKSAKYLAILVSPLFFAGALWGDEIIRSVLGDHWVPVIFLFRAFCVVQLIVALSIINAPVHTSMGRAHWELRFYAFVVVVMPASVFVAAQYGIESIAIPWLTIFPALSIGWTLLTIRKLRIGVAAYVKNSGIHVLAALLIVGGVKLLAMAVGDPRIGAGPDKLLLALELCLAGALYAAYLWNTERPTLLELWNLRKT